MQRHNEHLQIHSSAASFLKSDITSCKVLGHSAEAAKNAQKNSLYYQATVQAMHELLGCNCKKNCCKEIVIF